MKKLLCSILMLLFFPLCFVQDAAAAGQDLKTLDAAGLKQVLRASKGAPVMLNFFATWCPPCKKEIPELVELSKLYKGKVRFVGLCVDDDTTIDRLPTFLQQNGVTYPIYRAGSDLVAQFSVRSIPCNVFFDKKGKMALAGNGVLTSEEFIGIFDDLMKKK